MLWRLLAFARLEAQQCCCYGRCERVLVHFCLLQLTSLRSVSAASHFPSAMAQRHLADAAKAAAVHGADGFVRSTAADAWQLPNPELMATTWSVSDVPPVPSAPLQLCKPEDEVQVHFLCDAPHFLSAVAQCQWDEWADVFTNFFGIFHLADVEKLLSSYLKKDRLGYILVATVKGQFAGTATLTTDDVCAGHPYWGAKPWLTCLWVEPAFRRRGIAATLFTLVADQARAWNYRCLWLITEDQQAMYAKHSWRAIETLQCWAPRNFTVMRRDFQRLDAPPPFVPKSKEELAKLTAPATATATAAAPVASASAGASAASAAGAASSASQ